MTLDIVAFTIAGLYLAATFAMLTVGLIGFMGSPVTGRCRRCSRWVTSVRGDAEPVCPRCRRQSPAPTARHQAWKTW
ncbi:hypothetical protein D7D52_02130 [Nocardia yunnanensis]|uniref:Zinc ribbon domain-containing protein n=1 Tax=Nocardia yunnanensis TaxID=2382165 RepID=A0A386Z5C9_9NOCA|nr:hypothetical protein [Nocardia yunnanensis]AYF72861.1 hypothetical protein D7D52_02130 [Nocardia yunnanensis]